MRSAVSLKPGEVLAPGASHKSTLFHKAENYFSFSVTVEASPNLTVRFFACKSLCWALGCTLCMKSELMGRTRVQAVMSTRPCVWGYGTYSNSHPTASCGTTAYGCREKNDSGLLPPNVLGHPWEHL